MNNKGFTLVELLATIAILGILIGIGTMVVNNITDNTKINYYKSEENTLAIAGNEYFNDNRDDKPIDDYNFVDLKTLQEHEYLEELKTHDGKELCSEESGVYIYNDNGTSYETCLICGDYRSPGPFCNGKRMGTIRISGNINTPDGPAYNPLLSYSGSSWVNASTVYIHFGYEDEEGKTVTSYKIYNGSSSTLYSECTNISNNRCTKEIPTTGSYYVEAYGVEGKIGSRKYFNVKIDNVKPKYDVAKGDEDILLKDDEIYYDYENEILNINDDNGYKSVTYTLTRYNPTYPANTQIISQDVDIKDKDLKISHKLASGRYDLYITVKDFAGNIGESTRSHIRFYIKYKVDLRYYDIYDKQHDAGNIEVYTYGKYEQVSSTNTNGNYQETVVKTLPRTINIGGNESEPVTWYKDANFSGTAISNASLVDSTGYHLLYGKESRKATKFTSSCIKNNGKNLVYNREDQQLATTGTGYSLVVYYNGTKTNNIGKDAGTYTVIAVLDSLYQWEDGTRANKYIQCEIEKAPVTVPSCKNPTYNGHYQELVSNVGSDVLDPNGIPSAVPHCAENDAYGPCPEMDFSIANFYGFHAGSNYKVKFHLLNDNYKWADNTRADKEITCSIGKKSIKVIWGEDTTFTYDGKSHAPTATVNTGLSYNSMKLAVTKEIDAGSHSAEASCDSASSTLSELTPSCSDFTLTNTTKDYKINKRSITYVASNQSKKFDGEALVADETCAITKGSLVSGHTATCSSSGIQKTVGSKEKKLDSVTISSSAGDVTKNYDISKGNGTLTISKCKLVVTADSDSKNYDGEALTKNSYTFVSDSNIKNLLATRAIVKGSITDIGTTDNVVSGFMALVQIMLPGRESDILGVKVGDNCDIEYKKGKLEVYDNEKPTCSLSVSTDGTISATSSDNHDVTYKGFSTSYGGETTKSISSAGTYYYYVKDKSGNSNSCSIKVKYSANSVCGGYYSYSGSYAVTGVDGGVTKYKCQFDCINKAHYDAAQGTCYNQCTGAGWSDCTVTVNTCARTWNNYSCYHT